MPEDNNGKKPEERDYFNEFLDKTFGKGTIDPDNFDARDLERDRRIKENMRLINTPLGKVSHGQTEPSDGQSQRSDHKNRPSDQTIRPSEQTGEQTVPPTSKKETPPLDLAGYKIKTSLDELETLARTPLRKKLLLHLLEEGNQVTSYRQILQELGIKTISTRRSLEHFEQHGIIQKATVRSAQVQGLKISLNLSEEARVSLLEKLKGADGGTDHRADRGADGGTNPFLERKKDKDLSFLEKLLSWTDEQMAEWYPALHTAGFKRQNLQQVVESLDSRNKSLDLIPVSLEYAEWELANREMKGKDGNPVGSPASYVFSALVKQGHYRRPKNYIDPQEQALQREKARLEALQREKEALEEKAFQVWRESLSPEQISQYQKDRTSSQFPVPEDIFLRNVWRQSLEDKSA